MTDDLDDLLDTDGDEGDDTDTDSDADGGESSGDKTPKSTDKRIRDLQSQKDKETARANKAEKQLKALLSAGDAEDGNPAGAGAGNDGILDMARMFAYQQHPKLAEYGISQSDLSGDSPAAIAESATELVARFESVETKVRNKLLADQGLAPEIDGGAPAPARDFSKMPKEDFDKLVDAAMKGSSG